MHGYRLVASTPRIPTVPYQSAGRGGAGTGPTSGHGKSGGEKTPVGKSPSPPPRPIQPDPNERDQ